MKKQENKKKQFIIFGLCSFAALIMCMITLVVTVSKVEKETGSGSERKAIVNKTELSGDKNELSEYIFSLTEYTVNNKFVKVNSYTDVSIDDEKISVSDSQGNENEEDKELFIYIKNKLLGEIDKEYGEDFEGKFGTACENMPLLDFSSTDNMVARMSQGLTDENGETVYNDDGTITDEEFYFISFSCDGKKLGSNEKLFYQKETPDIKSFIENRFSSVMDINNLSVSEDDFSVNAKIHRETDELSSVEIVRRYNVTAQVNFKGSLGAFGSKSISFQYTVSEKYDYFYAGISFAENEVSLGYGDEVMLNVNAVIEDDSDYIVRFISSDEGIATVDEMGYVKLVKACDTPAVITVELEYMGEIFTDQCVVKASENKEVLV